jgi:hypothetical protein
VGRIVRRLPALVKQLPDSNVDQKGDERAAIAARLVVLRVLLGRHRRQRMRITGGPACVM